MTTKVSVVNEHSVSYMGGGLVGTARLSRLGAAQLCLAQRGMALLGTARLAQLTWQT